jgi:cellulose synthase/poly-beta-1,6-N-acetylglucosamine synthase-like glycosyltransferase
MYKDLTIQTFFWFLGFLFLFRIQRCKRCSGETKSYPSVSVIIPARNEEKSLPILLASLREQVYTPEEIIVVVGPSEDKTVEVAERSNVKVIRLEPTPEGWVGKPWACYQGALAAKGDILVFLEQIHALKRTGSSAFWIHTSQEVVLSRFSHITQRKGFMSNFLHFSISS